jgi:hypothetical protein
LEKYKWVSYGYCNKCGFGSCEHLTDDATMAKMWHKLAIKMNKAFFENTKKSPPNNHRRR